MSKRPSRKELYMQIAELISQRGTCERAKVGAIITMDNRIISTGYNGSVIEGSDCENLGCDINKKCQHSMHAEANAIVFAARQGIQVEGGSLYCTHEPCLECAKLIIQAGIKEVTFNHYYTTNPGTQLLISAGINIHFPS